MSDPPLRVLVVDDTVVYRRILGDVVQEIGGAVVAGVASHGRLALTRMEQDPVDLVLLDLEMPEMDGLETLEQLRKRYPQTGVIMVSSTSRDSANSTLKALECGALDFVRKPEGTDPMASRRELVENLKPLFRMFRTRLYMQAKPPSAAPSKARPVAPESPREPARIAAPAAPRKPDPVPRIDIVAIGVSTGGPNALAEVIPLLPADLRVPVLIVQHMPPVFTASLAEHLDKRSRLNVREAQDGEPVSAGVAYIAPGGRHMLLRRADSGPLTIGLTDGPPENSCRPAVDVLFRSIAAHCDGNALAVVMTGMGYDGREGVRALKRKGAYCLTQGADSCVVYGMPLAVDEAGLSDEQVPLSQLAGRIVQLVSGRRAV